MRVYLCMRMPGRWAARANQRLLLGTELDSKTITCYPWDPPSRIRTEQHRSNSDAGGRPPTRLKTPRDTALQRRGMWLPWKKAKKAKTNLELEDYEGLETIAWRMKIIMPNSTFRVAWDWALVRIGSVSNLGFNPATASSQAVAQRLRLRIWLALRSSSFYV